MTQYTTTPPHEFSTKKGVDPKLSERTRATFFFYDTIFPQDYHFQKPFGTSVPSLGDGARKGGVYNQEKKNKINFFRNIFRL